MNTHNKPTTWQIAARALFIVSAISTILYFAREEFSKVNNAQQQLASELNKLEKTNQATLEMLAVIRKKLGENTSIMVTLFLNVKPEQRNAAYTQLDNNNTEIAQAQKALAGLVRSDKKLASLSAVTKLIEKFRDDLQGAVEGIELSDIVQAQTKFVEYGQVNMMTLMNQIFELEALCLAEDKVNQVLQEQAQAKLLRSEILIILLSVIVAAMSIFTIFKITEKNHS
jgi:hypothetical protein